MYNGIASLVARQLAQIKKTAVLFGCLVLLQVTVNTASANPPPGYYLVWSDEFNGTNLDLSKWFYFTGPAQWTIDTDTFTVTNGYLTINTYQDQGTIYSGILSTDGHFRPYYGYFESSIQWGDSNAMYSAFWLQTPNNGEYLFDPGVSGTELDICEHRYVDVSNTNVIQSWVQETLHWNAYGPYEQTYQQDNVGTNLNIGFHSYGFLWTPTNYTWSIDNATMNTTTVGLSGRSEVLMLSSQVNGGSWAGIYPPGGYGDLPTNTTKMTVDYARYYAPTSMLFWTGVSSANWNDSGNYLSNMTVSAANDVIFDYLSLNNFTINFSNNTAINSLTIQETPPMSFNGSTLTVSNRIDLVSAFNDVSINCPLMLGGDQTWKATGGRTLNINNTVGGAGNLTIAGYGLISVNGAMTNSGMTTVTGGTLLLNSSLTNSIVVAGGTLTGLGAYNGPVEVQSGTILAGLGSPLTINNSLTIDSGGSVTFYTDPNNGVAGQLAVQKSVTFGGTLVLANQSGPYAVGQTFKLFNSPHYSGQFTTFSPTQPGYEMAWDTSTLTNDGILRVKYIPPVATTNIFESRSGNSTTGVNTASFSYNGFSSTISANKSTAAGCTTPGSSRFTSTLTTATSFTVTPTLLVGPSYYVDVTWGNGGSFPETPTIVVAPTTAGVSSNNLPATTSAFSGLTGNTNNNRWQRIGSITPNTVNPSVTFTYVSGYTSGRWYADAVRFTSILPPSPASITNKMMGTNLVLNWAGQFTLQYATNVAGPFLDVPGQVVTGPYTNLLTNQQVFFRLRQ